VNLTSMTELSPAAQKILRADAAERCLVEWSSVNDPPCHPSDEGWNGCVTCVNRAAVAAALRAAALHCKRDTLILLAIADELEAQ
jgi:hypothetical protein